MNLEKLLKDFTDPDAGALLEGSEVEDAQVLAKKWLDIK